jgi:cytochrome c oxidase subunit IV
MDTTTHKEHAHPNTAVYVKVALWLGLITAIEIAISYIEMADWIAIVSLVGLSLVKFTVVVGYFMHLKFDNKLLRKPFITGVVLAAFVYTAVLLSLLLHSNAAPAPGI